MSKEEDHSLLAKWLEGQITPDEMRQLEQEVDLQALHQTLEQQKKFDLEHRSDAAMWKAFEAKIKTTEKTPAKKTRKPWAILFLIAIILAGLAYFFLWPDGQTMKTRPGERKELIIADGTKIQLTPGTSLGFDSTKWAISRAMTLEGQALFEVSKGTPFKVQTDQGLIEVLGTHFDIWSIGALMRIQCFEGRVQVSSSKSDRPLTLNAGQQLYVRQNVLGTVELFEAKQVDWMRDERIYQKTPLALVIKDIERFFAVRIDAQDLNTDLNFSGRIPISDLDKALDYLCRSMKWKYEKDHADILLSPE